MAGVSFAGGASAMIDGLGYNDEPAYNQVRFNTNELTGSDLAMPGNPLTGKLKS